MSEREPAALIACPDCGVRVPITINAAVAMTGHLEDEHGYGFDRVMRTVVATCGGEQRG